MSPARLKDIIKENISFLILFIAGLLLILLLDMILDEVRRSNDIDQRRLEH